MPRVSFETEVALSVEDYIEVAGGIQEAFEFASKEFDDAKEYFYEDLREGADVNREDVVIEEIEFNEFDSSNWTHASAYFFIKFNVDAKHADTVKEWIGDD